MNRYTMTDPMPRPETHRRVRRLVSGGYIEKTMSNAEAEQAVRDGAQIVSARRPGEEPGEAAIAMRSVQPSDRA